MRHARVLAPLLALALAPLVAGAQPKGDKPKGGAAPPKAAPSASASAAAPAPSPSAPPPAPSPAAPPPAAPPPEPAPPPAADDDAAIAKKRADAKAAFERGLKLYKENLLQAALAEFLASREILPTRSATKNAAVALESLSRFDEALEMFENLLREFPTLPPEDKALAQKSIADLRGRVGTVDVEDAEPGASVVVDGKSRGDFPLVAPLRVAVGSHSVRVFKQGFEPFETQVNVAGGKTVRVTAKLKALEASGKLRISEAQGRRMDVLVDGAVVGVTPWEGNVSVGEHVVVLRGDEALGTPPAAAPVKLNDLTALSLSAEVMDAGLVVNVVPKSARVWVDAVAVGRGVFDGALKSGAHKIEVKADGFFPSRKEVVLEKGDKKVVTIELKRDEDAAQWKKPSRFTLGLSGGFAVGPGLEGDVNAACGPSCSRSPSLGGLAMLHLGYEFGSGLGIGVAGGFLQIEQTLSQRSASLEPVGRTVRQGFADDALRMRGFLAGATIGYHLGDKFPALFRLGAGAFVGNVRDLRTNGLFTTAQGQFAAPDRAANPSAVYFYVDPEVQVSLQPIERLEIGLSLQALLLIGIQQPKWGDAGEQPISVPGDGYSLYPGNELLSGQLVFTVVPGLSARYAF